MKKTLIAAALLVSLGGVNSRAAEYTFYANGYGAFCDGVRFEHTVPAVGYHIFDQGACPGKPDYLGGFETPNKNLGPGNWYTFPVSNRRKDAEGEKIVDTVYINVHAMSWVLAEESADLHYPFTVLTRGYLVKGAPGEQPGAAKLGVSAVDAARARMHPPRG
jgi:hypothetical protein